MLENAIYALIILILSVSLIGLIYLYSKSLYAYITDGADLRVCPLSEFMIFGIVILIETSVAFVSKDFTAIFCFCLRTYVMFSFYLLLCCRLIGYRNVIFKNSLKSILYVTMCTLFYFSLILFIIFNKHIYEPRTSDLLKFNTLCLIAQVLYKQQAPLLIKLLPSLFATSCYAVMIMFDLVEKRSHKTRYMDVALSFSLILSFFSLFKPMSHHLRNVSVCIMILLPILGFYRESNSILHYCQPDVNKTKEFHRLLNKVVKMSDIKKQYYARYISKLIKEGFYKLDSIPDNKKYAKFLALVKEYLK